MAKSIWAHEPILTPERRVWRAVLSQTIADAETAATRDETTSEPVEATRARHYLSANDPEEVEDFKLVCDFADVPVDRLILWARRRYAQANTFGKHVECGSEAVVSLAAESSETSEKRELCSWAPSTAVPGPSVAPA